MQGFNVWFKRIARYPSPIIIGPVNPVNWRKYNYPKTPSIESTLLRSNQRKRANRHWKCFRGETQSIGDAIHTIKLVCATSVGVRQAERFNVAIHIMQPGG